MQHVLFSGNPVDASCDCLVVAVDDGWRDSELISQLSSATDGLLLRLLNEEEISIKPNKVTQLLAPPGLSIKLLIVVGLGPRASINTTVYQRAAASALKSAMSKPRGVIRMVGFSGTDIQERAAVSGAMIGYTGQDLFRAERSLHTPSAIEWVGLKDACVAAGNIIGESVNLTRRLVNLPANYIHPESFADESTRVAGECGLEIEIWDKQRLEKERCGSLLAVARGSVRDPRLIIFKYNGGSTDEAPIALVGKGVTFDSGGYSIKPTDGMLTMKCDMAGAATVLGILRATSLLKVKKNIVGVVGLVENLISGDAFKLGDVLTARSGKTIEIHNTDAEGRLVLADCLNVVLEHKPSHIVDFATLTGACCVALGNDIAGLMTNNSDWQTRIQQTADLCGEFTWPLPMHSFFSEQIAGKIADIKNVGEGRWGGAITAAKFLEEFVDGCPWTHIDIAGPAFLDSAKPWADAGGTGVLVRTFTELLSE